MERSRVSSLLFVQLEEASTASQSDSDVRCATPPSKGDGDIILSSEGPKDEETPVHPVDMPGRTHSLGVRNTPLVHQTPLQFRRWGQQTTKT